MQLTKNISFLLIILGFLNTLSAQDSTIISFERKHIDFQAIYEADGSIPVTFNYTNTGKSPLKINRILSHGFKSVHYPKEAIAPGESAKISIQLNPFGKSGYFEKNLIVFTNTVNSPNELSVKGKILNGSYKNSFKTDIGGLGLKQLQFNFGYVFKGDISIRYLPVVNNSKSELDVSFENIPKHLAIKNKFDKLAPGKKGLIEITYNTNELNDWDFVIDKLKMNVISDKTETGVFMVSANIRENFMLLSEKERLNTPKASIPVKIHNYDTITSGSKISAKFPIYNLGQRDLSIRSVKPTCGCTAALPEKNVIAPGDSTFIVVEFNSFGFTGSDKKGVTIITNDPDKYKQFLWVNGYIE